MGFCNNSVWMILIILFLLFFANGCGYNTCGTTTCGGNLCGNGCGNGCNDNTCC